MWTDEAVKRFWHAMGQTFGKSWYDHNGPEPTAAWRSTLNEMSLDRAAAVLDYYRGAGLAFPPNLSQFTLVARATRGASERALPSPARQQDPRDASAAVLQRSGQRYHEITSEIAKSGAKNMREACVQMLRKRGLYGKLPAPIRARVEDEEARKEREAIQQEGASQ